MVERFHRQLKEALRARSGGTCWLEHLPWVLLGLRTAPKEEAGISSAEAALGSPLQLPGKPLPLDRPDVPSGAGATLRANRVIPATTRTYADVAAGKEETVVPGLMYMREGQPRGPLAPTYSGPYKVLERHGKVLKLQLGECADRVVLERVKIHAGEVPVDPAQPPAHGLPRKCAKDNSGAAEDSGNSE